jgi:hypothetical protein
VDFRFYNDFLQVSHLTTTLSRTELSLSDKQAALLESQQESKQLSQSVANLRQELDTLTAQHEHQTELQVCFFVQSTIQLFTFLILFWFSDTIVRGSVGIRSKVADRVAAVVD